VPWKNSSGHFKSRADAEWAPKRCVQLAVINSTNQRRSDGSRSRCRYQEDRPRAVFMRTVTLDLLASIGRVASPARRNPVRCSSEDTAKGTSVRLTVDPPCTREILESGFQAGRVGGIRECLANASDKAADGANDEGGSGGLVVQGLGGLCVPSTARTEVRPSIWRTSSTLSRSTAHFTGLLPRQLQARGFVAWLTIRNSSSLPNLTAFLPMSEEQRPRKTKQNSAAG
jgi:hypothetical protein